MKKEFRVWDAHHFHEIAKKTKTFIAAMTPQEARDAAKVMIAFAEGKQIEFRRKKKTSHPWERNLNPCWYWQQYDYRVAAEPWQGKIWVHPDGHAHHESYFNVPLEKAIEQGWRLITAKEAQDE